MVRDVVEMVGEQVAVEVQGHARRLVPSIACTTLTFATAAIANDAAVWRSPCEASSGSPIAFAAGANVRRAKFRFRSTSGRPQVMLSA
jgi:hypothetical protein